MQHLPLDQQVDRYVLQEEIGSGGMGHVYSAIDTATGEYVAVKVAGGPEAKAVDFRRRFEREAEIVSHLHHPNILPVLDYGSSDGRPFMAMPLVRGGTLKEFLSGGGILTPQQTLTILSQVGAALDYAHQQGIVHRDVKPHNIMLLGGDRVCLADFGLVKFATASITRLTLSSDMIGTPSYMSPEQIRGVGVDGRSDLYSLSTVAYECLLGRLPFHAGTVYGLISLQSNAPPLLPTVINPDFPRPLEAFLLTGLDKDPALRYQTGADMIQEYQASLAKIPGHLLDEVLVTRDQIEASFSIDLEDPTLVLSSLPDSTISPRSQAGPGSTRRRWLAAFFGALIVLLTASLAWIVGIQPIQARAFSVEQTAQALGQQTPLVVTQMVTQIVTNAAGQPVVIVITQLVTGTPGPTSSPQGQAGQGATPTPRPSATPPSTRPPTATPPPQSLSGVGTPSGAGARATQAPAATSAPVPTALLDPSPPAVIPTAAPTSPPPGQVNTPPGQSGDPPGQSGDPPGQSGDPPGQSGDPPGQSGDPPGQGNDPPAPPPDPPGQSNNP